MLLNTFKPLNAHYAAFNHFPLSTLLSLFLSSSPPFLELSGPSAFFFFFAFHPKVFSPSHVPWVLYLTTLCWTWQSNYLQLSAWHFFHVKILNWLKACSVVWVQSSSGRYWPMNPAFPAHLPMENISEGGSIKIPRACSVNIVNSLMSLLMEKISPAYISVKVSQLWRMMNYSANDKSFKNRAGEK